MSFVPSPLVTASQKPSISFSAAPGSSGNPSTPLRSIKGKRGFTYPAIWSFPPFFTLQPNPATLAHQIELWTILILDWARHEKVFMVNVEGVAGDGLGEVFENATIRRRLLSPSIRTILTSMVKEGRAIADPPKQTDTYLLLWKKPEEWGTEIYDWVMDNGLGGSIMTFWEITEGDLTDEKDFHTMPAPLLRRAIDTLVRRSKAQIIKGDGEAGEGVRFF